MLLAITACAIGAWELLVTRLSSVLFFIGITHVVLGISLLGFALGAIATDRLPAGISVLQLALATVGMMPFCWWALSAGNLAWIAAVFAWPFATFGAASTLTWRAMAGSGARSSLYCAEAMGTVLGLVLLGPLLLQYLPINSTGQVGINSHLYQLIEREGLRRHEQFTNAYATTDVIQTRETDAVYFFTDARFVTRSVAWDGYSSRFASARIEDLARMKRLALASAATDQVLLLGAGAGFDMAVALQAGAKEIDAVEVNRETITQAQKLDDWAGGVMRHDRVSIHIAEARRFISRQDKKWDQVNLTLMQTSPASGRGSSHVDGRVLTAEALATYLEHLRPLGTVSIIQNTPHLAERTVATALSVLDSDQQILRFALPETDATDNAFNQLILLRNEPFSAAEVAALTQQAAALRIESTDIKPRGLPVTDDNPFMFESFFSSTVHTLTAAALALILFGVALLRTRNPELRTRLAFSAALTGAVMLAVQALIIYRAQSALGNPVVTLSVALSATLLGAGLGAFIVRLSGLQARWKHAGLAAGAACLFLALTGQPLVTLGLALPDTAAALVVGVYIFFCALPLGLPFLAVMDEGRRLPGDNEPLILASDGIGGVIGAALGSSLAMLYGFNALALLVLGLLVVFTLQHRSPV